MKQALATLLMILTTTLFGQSDSPVTFVPVEDLSNLSILSPTLRERQTTKIRLSNGLEAYLISDPGVDQSAAALAVHAGSWDDPDAYPGMAHFLEHMLFMGTKAYPKEFEYMQFISDHGGKVNAYTAADRTVYMFSVNNEGFQGALDRFAHFFIDPLFLPSCIERELHAVDQEHAKNIEHDGWRQYMIFKEMGNPNHPVVKFSTGNADTLRGIPQQAMKQWYKEHYSAEKMHLVVLSSLPINELIELTVRDFSEVPINPQVVSRALPENMTSEKQRGHMIFIKPIKDMKVLSLSWELPPTLGQDQTAHVGELLSYTLSSGSKNSLLGLLKRKHLASAIRSGEERLGSNHTLFSIDVELTDQGLTQVDEVISYCFEALARLKSTGIPRYIFDEVKTMAELKYAYQSRQDPFGYVMGAAHTLVDEDLATYPRLTRIPSEYNPPLIASYLDHLTPENCIYYVMADPEKTNVPTTQKETWMGAEYSVETVSLSEMHTWANAHINPEIGLPPPNPFIPKNLELVHETKSEAKVVPSLIQDNDRGKIYFATDEHYLSPELTQLFKIKSPLIDGSARATSLGDLYLKALEDALFPVTSAAENAGAQIALSIENLGLGVAITGYSDGAQKLSTELFQGMKKMRPTKEQFALYKQALLADYENGGKELPLLQAISLLNSMMFNDAPTNQEKLAALKSISYEDFTAYTSQLLKKCYVEGLIYGNITQNEGERLWSKLRGKLKASPYPIAEQHKRSVLILSEENGPYMVMESTPMLGNAALLVIEQGNYSYEKRAAQQILGKVLKDAFFDTLRTKQQVAYIAKSWDKEEEMQLVQYFAVQSSSHQPSDLIARFELFLEDFLKQFTTKLTRERFDQVKKMAITSLQMPPENLTNMGVRLFLLAFDYRGDFDLVQKRVKGLKELTYEQLRDAASAFLSRKNSRRVAVLVEGMTPKEKEFRYELIHKDELSSHGQFVAWK